MKLKTLFGLLLAFLPVLLFATNQPVIKWNDIPKADLQMTSYDKDPEADALILADIGDINFEIDGNGAGYQFDRHRRIKIFKRSAVDKYGDIAIEYNDDYHQLRKVRAQVIKPDGTRIEVDKNDMFDERTYEEWTLRKFSFPQLEEGDVIEYSYIFESNNLHNLQDWYFQWSSPVRLSQLRVEMPEWMHYNYLFQGEEGLTINSQERGTIPYRGNRIQSRIYRYGGEDIPALKQESYVTTMDDYRMRIRFKLKEIAFAEAGWYETYNPTWNEVAENLEDSEVFGKRIRRKNNFYQLLRDSESFVSDAVSETDKALAIYNFLLEKMEWDGMYTKYAYETLDEYYNKRKAPSGVLNLMMIALMQEYDLTAHPVIISTRTNGKLMQYYPMLRQFDHTLIFAELDGNQMLIDVGNPLRPMGMIREEALNQNGLMLQGNEAFWIQVTPPVDSETYFANLVLDETGTLSGDFKVSLEGYIASGERQRLLKEEKGEFWNERLGEQFVSAKIDEYSYENMEIPAKPIQEAMKIHVEEAAQVNGNFMYLSPTVYSTFTENPFKLEARTYPVDIPYPFKEQYITNIEIPEGYRVEELPENVKLVLGENGSGGMFSYRVSQNGNTIQIIKKFEVMQTYFQPTDYEAIKNFWDMMLEKQGEQIVLVKA